MPVLGKWLGFLSALFVATAAQAAKTQVQLIFDSEAGRPGDTIMAGLKMKMPSGMHTYWRYSGDSGGPTKIEWQLPPGITAGAIQWPVPEKYVASELKLTTYVYHDVAVLLVPFTISGSAAAGPAGISGKVSWIECTANQCFVGRGNVKATLVVGDTPKKSADTALIETWQKKLPDVQTDVGARASWEKTAGEQQRNIIIEWNLANRGADPDFFPFESKGYEVAGPTEKLSASAGKARVRKAVKKQEGDWPAQLAGLLVEKAGLRTKAFHVQMPIMSAQSAALPSGDGQAAGSTGPTSIWLALVFAFLGGLILNVMPCVLPVIALKILGFVEQSHQSPGEVRRLGLVYAGGVLVSFLALALIAIGIRAAGHVATWGSQFQNPKFVVAMTVIMTLVTLNLFGVFEVTLSGRAMGAASDLSGKHGATGAFFNGLLATALATSCTAPVLALALGFAQLQPPHIIVLIFLMIGLGLAAPYILLSWYPSLLRFLPKPGAWMEKFKLAMGFPVLATALWLLARTADHFGDRGPLWVGLFLVLLAFAAWVWGEFVQRSTRRRGLAIAACLLLLGFGYGYCLENELGWRSPQTAAPSAGNQKRDRDGIDWQPWSTAAVEKAQGEGRPVLVDFTAKWCLTCQLTKSTALEVSSVRAKIKQTNTAALIADFTREDPLIAEELKRFNNAAVPLVLVYPKDRSRQPKILPTWPLLTPGIVVSALDDAAK